MLQSDWLKMSGTPGGLVLPPVCSVPFANLPGMAQVSEQLRGTKTRAWVFTLNNYTDEDIERIDGIECRYVGYGKETGDSGTPHLQGLIVFKNPRAFGPVRSLFNARAHIEPMRGNVDQALQYCQKDGDYYERGDKPQNVAKSSGINLQERYREAISMAKAGDIESLEFSYPDIYLRFQPRLQAMLSYNLEARSYLDNYWIYGSSGSGKTVRAELNVPYYQKNQNKWWDGYRDEYWVIIHEWAPNDNASALAQYLKKWSDHGAFQAEIKGGSMGIRPRGLIITSNYPIEKCFPAYDDYDPLKRRFTEIEMNEKRSYEAILRMYEPFAKRNI